MKNIYTARIETDEELLTNLGFPRIGGLEVWFVESKGVSWSSYLIVPDFTKTDTFSFDVLFDDDFRKEKDVKIGDCLLMSIPSPKILREVEIVDITQGEPINNIENKRVLPHGHAFIQDHLSSCLYHEIGVNSDEDGWFDVNEVISFISKLGLFDLKTLELIVNHDEDHRYILSGDRTKIRISPDHQAPKDVEEQLKNKETLSISKSVFKKNKLPFVKDKKRCVEVTDSNGCKREFPYETNKVFIIDEKHFLMLIILEGEHALLVSSYMTKNTNQQYRMRLSDMDKVINNVFPLFADIKDFEDVKYKVSIEDKYHDKETASNLI